MDLSDHTDCCGSECKLFHLGACSLNSPRPARSRDVPRPQAGGSH